jgi:hypothetical protein
MNTLKFPLEFSNGDAVRLTQGARPYYEQLLSLGLQTRIGELPITPIYGVVDPAFDAGAQEQIITLVAQYFPELSIRKLTRINDPDTGQVNFQITFDIVA